ncbi:hypothetical protein JCM6882_008046 [Rhodosporidiobolus microsporus]
MADAVRPVSSENGPVFVRALYDYQGGDASSLSFRQGEILEILSTLESGWWDGVALSNGARGWLPSNYVAEISEQEAQAVLGGGDSRRQSTASMAGGDEGYAAGVVGDFAAMNLTRDHTFSDFMATAEDDLTSFSAGGDIFSEIAAAAQAESTGAFGTAASLSQPLPTSSTDHSTASSFPGLSSTSSANLDAGDAPDEEEDFWVPKMTVSGQLFYYNTRSGETSRDMPIDGRGDGVRIDPSDFSVEEGEAPPLASAAAPLPALGEAVGDWVERATADGRGRYFVNLRTGEQSWDPPSLSRRGSGSRLRAGDAASLVSGGWTERPPTGPKPADVQAAEGAATSGEGEETGAKRLSVGSDDSALDAVFAGAARRERPASLDATPVKAVSRPGAAAAAAAAPATVGRKPAAFTAELLNPLPPPLISDLEEIATRALQELINTVGLGGLAGGRDPAGERDRLARIGDEVVHAVRLVLHSSGVLEHPVVSSPFAATISPFNEITGHFLHSSPLPPSAQADLRPFSRRLISTLSKLTFSLRAMWGLLETTAEDQHLPEDDSPADPEEVLRREQQRQQDLAERRAVREARFEHETKLRSEIMQGTRDVSDQVLTFLQHFQRVVASVAAADGHPPLPLEQLRAPKALQGSLRTNAAALLLPGGGFGGNWRGNGFVSLPTPHSSPNPNAGGSDGERKVLSYAWPSRPISKELVEELKKTSDGLVEDAKQLESAAAADGAELAGLFDRASTVQEKLAAFLVQVEDVDVAAGVDFQLSRNEESRASSRPESTATGVTTPAEGEADEAATSAKAYKASVLEAKPLLAEFEARKQALYDIAPRLMLALQNAVAPPAAAVPSSGQPPANSPLSAFPSPSVPTSRPDFSAVRSVAADLSSAPPALCTTLTSLAGIAEVQASAPKTLRTHSLAFRNSLFVDSAGFGSVQTSESGHGGAGRAGAGGERMSVTRSSQSHDSTFRSSYRSSADSDFFFSGTTADARRAALGGSHLASGGAGSSSTSLTGSGSGGNTVRSTTSQPGASRAPMPFGSVSGASSGSGGVEVLSSGGGSTGLPPGWDRRRGSVATAGTSGTSSSAGTANPSLTNVNEYPTMSPSRSSSKNIQKLLGEIPASIASSPTEDAKPWYLDRDWDDEDLSFTMENTVKGGTLRGLVIAATSHEGRVDSSYLSAFLMTYRTFCTSAQLLDQLIERYLVIEPEGLSGEEFKEWEAKKLRPIKARVTNLLKAWVREYMDHEDLDPVLLQRIREFALNTMTEKGQSLQICKSVDERLQGAAPRTIGNLAPGALPQPIVPRNLKKFKLTDLEPLELARQLTIMDSRLFQRITPQECLSKAWPKEFGNEAPNISAMIDMSNAVTRWVTETILAQEDLKKRANIVKHFIAVAERCLSLNNFSTLIHIIAGLNSTPIHRLRRTWEAVSQKAMISLGMLNNVMRPDRNYREYRDILRRAPPPCVPFLGVYLTDWVFIGDGNPDLLKDRQQVNFGKRQKASELILQIKLHQATSYNLAQVPQIAKWLQLQLFPAQVHPDTETYLYELSLALEPRERDDEKIARLLSESGFL